CWDRELGKSRDNGKTHQIHCGFGEARDRLAVVVQGRWLRNRRYTKHAIGADKRSHQFGPMTPMRPRFTHFLKSRVSADGKALAAQNLGTRLHAIYPCAMLRPNLANLHAPDAIPNHVEPLARLRNKAPNDSLAQKRLYPLGNRLKRLNRGGLR